MQNNQNYSKITFKDGTKIVKSCYQVKNNELIPAASLPTKVIDNSQNELILKKYSFFSKWVEENTNKKIDYVPNNDTCYTAKFYDLEVQCEREVYVDSAVGTIILHPIYFDAEQCLYIKNVYCDTAYVSLNIDNSKFYSLNGETVVNLVIKNPFNYINQVLNIQIDVYKDSLLIKKIGTIEFKLYPLSSSNPSGD